MGAAASKDAGSEAQPSAALQVGLLGGYSGLIAVNYIFGKGLFGVPTNSELSHKWPSLITPAGYAFAIWGIIFSLQGGAVMLSLWPTKKGTSRARAACSVGPAFMATWACENAWQLCFAQMANVETTDSMARQLSVFVPCGALLWGGYLSALHGCRRLHAAEREGAVGTSAGVFKLAMSMNAGWLSAASCIGSVLIVQSTFGGVSSTPSAVPIAFAAAAAGGGAAAASSWGPGCIGLGYAGAVAWALQAVRFGPNVPMDVRSAALIGLATVGGACALSILSGGARKKVD